MTRNLRKDWKIDLLRTEFSPEKVGYLVNHPRKLHKKLAHNPFGHTFMYQTYWLGCCSMQYNHYNE